MFCGHFMADWDDHHFCPKCRDDLKGDDPCVSSNATDFSVCLSFSEEQRKKVKNRNRYKSKKDQSSSSVGGNLLNSSLLMTLCWMKTIHQFIMAPKDLLLKANL